MKTTAQNIIGLVALLGCLQAVSVNAGTLPFAIETVCGQALVAETEPGKTLTDKEKRQISDDLLRRARQSMAEGRLDAAESLLSQAEAINARYNPLNPISDTPAKLRRDLSRKQASASGKSNGPERFFPALPFGKKSAAPAVDPLKRDEPKKIDGGSKVKPLPPLGSSEASSSNAVKSAGYAQIGQELPIGGQTPAGISSVSRTKSGNLILSARRALALGDAQRATKLIEQAKTYRVSYGPSDDTPSLVETAIKKYADLKSQEPQRKGTESYRRQYARLMMEQAGALLKWNDLDEAERLANQAAAQHVSFSPVETNPRLLLGQIAAARRNSRSPKTDQPSGVIQASADIVTPATGVLPNGHQASRAYYDPAGDKTRNVPAAYQPQPYLAQNQPVPAPPRPVDVNANLGSANLPSGEQSMGMKFFAEGEAALRARDVKKALESFQKAAAYQNQLDPLTAQRLQDHLQLLSPQPATLPVAPQQTLAQEATAKQQILARQVLNDIARQENRAGQLRESDPATALAILEQARGRVEKAGLEPAARTAIIRRVDRDIAELKQFIEDNRARIELNDRNRAVLAEIDREKNHALEIQDKLGALVEQYNQKMEEQSYEEAEIIAKRAVELAPDNLTANQLLLNAKFIRRFQNNKSIRLAKESGFLDQLESVLDSSTPFDDRFPIRFPRDWNELTDRRARLVEKYRPARSEREIEIEQKLKTPVSVRFTNAPLSVVLEHLAQLAQVNLYIDPQGLQEEGVSSDSPVNINLQRDISLRSALHLILQPLHLNYVIKDEVLKITSEQYRAGTLYTMTYNVADLVVPIPNFVPNSKMGMSGAYNEGVSRVGFAGSGTFGGATPPLGVFSDASQSQGTSISANVLAQMGQSGQMNPQLGGAGGGNMPMGFGPGGLGGGSSADFDSLIELITTTISPESWTEVGGEGSISSYENNLTLVVSQTQEVHEDIVDLLEQLRRLQDLQVTIEVRFITLNDNFFERIGVDFDFDIDDDIDRAYQVFGRVKEDSSDDSSDSSDSSSSDDSDSNSALEPERDLSDVDHDRSVVVGMSAPGVFSADLDIPFTQNSYGLAIPQFGGFDASAGASLGFAILSDIEAYFFINAAQGDKRTNVLQAPKVTLFNGQQATVSDSSQKPFVMGLVPVVGDFAVAQQPIIVILSEGTSLTVQAVVSADRRFVRLTVVPFFSNIGDVSTFTFTGETTTTSDTSTEGPQTTPDDSTKVNNQQTVSRQGSTVQLPTYSFVTVTTTVSVPDGGTVLLGGIKRLSEGRNEFGTPMLDKIPYVSRLFRNVAIGRETQSLMMMVTPRIIIQEEEEERIGVVPTAGRKKIIRAINPQHLLPIKRAASGIFFRQRLF